MKLTNSRYYFDFNATTPLSSSVEEWLKGAVFCANPSSKHQSGQKAKKLVNETRSFLFETFGLSENDYFLFFHSGASEGINTLIRGFGDCYLLNKNKHIHYAHSTIDHSTGRKLEEIMQAWGHQVTSLRPLASGDFNKEDAITKLKSSKDPLLLNFLNVSNETGVIWPLEIAKEIKDKTNAFIHVDTVQRVGKTKDWYKLDSSLDAYTFSGHKFGALKGVGFSFVKKEFPFSPLIYGGSQQHGLRSGTENPRGIYTLKLALEDMLKSFNFEQADQAKRFLEEKIKTKLGNQGEIIGHDAQQRNCTTIQFYIKGHKSNDVMMKFDMQGMEISSGSACSSGASVPNTIMKELGYDLADCESSLRFSFSHHLTMDQAKEFWSKIEPVLSELVS